MSPTLPARQCLVPAHSSIEVAILQGSPCRSSPSCRWTFPRTIRHRVRCARKASRSSNQVRVWHSTVRNLKLTLQYDGTDYVGWQRQAEGTSIQGLVEDALAPMVAGRVVVHGAGRTDAG